MSDVVAGLSIDLDRLTKVYPGTPDPAVDDVSLHIPAGDLVVFVGPSGCGKTTTLRMINRMIEPTSGTIRLGDRDVTHVDPNKLRRGMGYVIQQIGLFPHLSIADNVATVPRLLGWPKARIRDRVEEMLSLVGLDPGEFANRFPRQLSGGQQQRVGVARALAADPPVLLMDEPFGATDPITRLHLQREFRRLQQELGKTVVFVTHDFEEALLLGDRIAVLAERSRVAQYDTPLRLLADPADPHVAAFVGEAGYVRMLGLVRADRVPLRPGPGPGTAQIRGDVTLREVTDRLLGGATAVTVVDQEGSPIGHLDFEGMRAATTAHLDDTSDVDAAEANDSGTEVNGSGAVRR